MKDKFYLVLFVFFSNFLISDEIKIGIGSCLDQDFPQPIWQPIEEENLDYFIFLGDNVYGDSIFENLYKMKRAYSKQKKLLPDFLDQTDIFAIWDDHDYGKNDGGSDYKYKKLAENLFLDFWNVPINDVRRSREGIYFSENKVFFNRKYKLIFLDTRYFRSQLKGKKGSYQKNNDESSTILGKEQWTWLEKELNSNFDYLFIFSSIQIIPEDHGFEKWSNFPNDRTKLLKILEKYKDRTILFSGDRHRSGIYKRNGIVEITSSSMNKPGSSFVETDKYLIGETYPQENFVFMEVFEKTIYVGIKDMYGNTLNSISVNY